jgi:hypothetical protein
MTDDRPRPDPHLDELASAHLDGRATPEEEARLASDPRGPARVARLAAARDAVGLPDRPVDPDRRDAAIAAALAAADEAAGAPVDELAAARRRRAARRLGWAAAAAAAVALAVAVPRLLDDDSGSSTLAAPGAADSSRRSTESAASEPFSAADGQERDATSAPNAAADSGAGAVAGADRSLCCPLPELGRADDLSGRVGPARRALDPDAAPALAPGPPTPEQGACLRELEAVATTPRDGSATPPAVVLRALAAVGDEPVVVLVVEQPDGGRELVAAHTSDCGLLGTVGL